MCECCGGDCRLCAEQMKQPLNEAYQNELLEAYQKISDTFDDLTQLMRRRVPYEDWPIHMRFPGINPELIGAAAKGEKSPISIEAFANVFSNKIQGIGRAEQQLLIILDDDLFCKSAFDPFWKSESSEFNLRLDSLRRNISWLNDTLWEVIRILRHEQEE